MSRNGKRHGKFFADSKLGGKKKALAAARIYRDELVVVRESRMKRPVARPLMVVRGNSEYCQIRIPLAGGGTTTTEFSVQRHGPKKAKALAVAAFNAAQSKK